MDNSFLGRGWSFPVAFSETGSAKMSEHEIDIDESLRILLMTYPGERVMQPEFGCRLRDFCFEDLTLRTETLMQDEIRRAILLNEPRVDAEDIGRRNLVFPFYLNEATDANI